MTETEIRAFKVEFKALLEKYDVGIGFSVSDCSDTHGLYDEKLVVYHNKPNLSTEDLFAVDGWCIDKNYIEV